MRRETRFAAGMLDALSPRLSSLASSTGLTSLECLGTPRVARTSASLESAPSVLLTPAPPLSTFRSVRTQPQTRGPDEVSTVVVLIGQIALARDDADETALRRPDHGRRDRRRNSHLRGLPSLPVHQN